MERRGHLLRLEDSRGFVGLGEATPLPDFGTEDCGQSERALESAVSSMLNASSDWSVNDLFDRVEVSTRGAPNARAALECAIADLEAQREGESFGGLCRRRAGLSGRPTPTVSIQALVGGTTPSEIQDSVAKAQVRGYRAYKMKLAISKREHRIETDLLRVEALRKAVGVESLIRLDANEAWTREAAADALGQLEPFDIDYVEQPVARDDFEGLAMLDRDSPVAVAADEALLGDGLERCLETRCARILIVKPAAIGGIRASITLARRAHELGLRIVWSSLIDGAVSRLAALHLAAGLALEGEAEIHGLGTGPLLARDLCDLETVHEGKIGLPDAPGLGLDDSIRSSGGFEKDAPIWTGAARYFEAPS